MRSWLSAGAVAVALFFAPSLASAQVEIRSFNVWTFKDGNVTEIRLFTDRESALAAFGK